MGLGAGEQIQGRVITALCPGALGIAAKNKRIIVVSSTNGKTTTTHLLATALEKHFGSVITNALGANQRAGVTAALVSADKSTEKQWAVLEVDERSLPTMYEELSPEIVVLGNLSRDQLDRFGEVSSISLAWKEMFSGYDVHIVANGCDPHIVFSTTSVPENNVEFVDLASKWHDDAHTCPMCGSLLTWDDSSHFVCPTGDFATPQSLVNPAGVRIKIENALDLVGEWNINNATLAYFAAQHVCIDDDTIFSSWKDVRDIAGRNAIFQLSENQSVQLFLAKNPAGWNETLLHLSDSRNDATIFAFNCNIADGKDPSWLYDVNFEDAAIENATVFGERATDMIVRLEVAGKSPTRATDIKNALAAHSDATHINIVASYTQFLSLSRTLPKLAMKETS